VTGRPPVALVLRALGLGDLLVAVPALRGLRRAVPDHELVLATPGALTGLALGSGAVDRVHPASGLDALDWPGPPPEVAVNLHGSGPQSHALLAATAPGVLVAFASPGFAGPPWPAALHEAERWCALVTASFGVAADPEDGLLAAYDGSGAGPVVVHPGAASPARRWPADRYAALARRLAATGRRVLLTGDAAEVGLCRSVARDAGLPAAAVRAGTTDVGALADLVGSATLVVSGDTGVAHLAAALDRPAVALFGPTPPAQWAPRWGRTTVLWKGMAPGDAPGDPHGPTTDPALAAVTVDDAWEACRGRLAEPQPSGRP
jgi:ADP-heptose:LPS heptosyltransferase